LAGSLVAAGVAEEVLGRQLAAEELFDGREGAALTGDEEALDAARLAGPTRVPLLQRAADAGHVAQAELAGTRAGRLGRETPQQLVVSQLVPVARAMQDDQLAGDVAALELERVGDERGDARAASDQQELAQVRRAVGTRFLDGERARDAAMQELVTELDPPELR